MHHFTEFVSIKQVALANSVNDRHNHIIYKNDIRDVMEFLSQYGLFLLKTLTLVVALLVLFAGFFSMSRKPKPKIEITSLNDDYDQLKGMLRKEILGEKIKKAKKSKEEHAKLYVIDFCGDIKATQVEQLRDEVTAILSVATPKDEVLVRIESPGGSVNGYGLAAAQLQRIRAHHIPLTACIDKVAASGGYLMACVANTIIAAPFAIIGSIGVVAQIPNFHRFLKKNDIDVELMTAGEYKRTLTMLGENTAKGREKFQEDLELIHKTFKEYVLKNRPKIDIAQVSTGEHWLAAEAINFHLIDSVATSDEYLINKMQEYKVFKINIHMREALINKFLKPMLKLMHPWA